MTANLGALLASLPAARVSGSLPDGALLRGLTTDSRAVEAGSIFVATRGTTHDGHAFIDAAIARGAAMIVAESPRTSGFDGIWCEVEATDAALARLAAAYYGQPASAVRLLATTGTNGKTTTSFLLQDILTHAGHRTGLISTVRVDTGAAHAPTIFTTPPAPELQRILAEMRAHGCTFAAIEASSHGLAQRRIDAVEVAVAGFTNLSRDHLDYHGTMTEYAAAKGRLFTELAAAAVFNVDDETGAAFAEAFRATGRPTLTVSLDPTGPSADLRVGDLHLGLDGTTGTLCCPDGRDRPFRSPLVGAHNLQNALLALGMAHLAGLTFDAALAGLAAAGPVPGRLERVGTGAPGEPAVFIDYAHTPDALDRVLGTLRECGADGAPRRILCVFGAGGDRDRGKRPAMAAAVAARADVAILTSDNPRTEDPSRILDDLSTGLPEDYPHARIPDRREAILYAVAAAKADDLLVIAGKGHEDYQIVEKLRLPFDDRRVAIEALEARTRSSGEVRP